MPFKWSREFFSCGTAVVDYLNTNSKSVPILSMWPWMVNILVGYYWLRSYFLFKSNILLEECRLQLP